MKKPVTPRDVWRRSCQVLLDPAVPTLSRDGDEMIEHPRSYDRNGVRYRIHRWEIGGGLAVDEAIYVLIDIPPGRIHMYSMFASRQAGTLGAVYYAGVQPPRRCTRSLRRRVGRKEARRLAGERRARFHTLTELGGFHAIVR